MLNLQTSRGRVVGLGRLKIPRIPKLGFDCEIPLLSFVVIKRPDDSGHIATCIHMQMDGYGDDVRAAIDDMVGNVWEHLYHNFSQPDIRESAWENLYELFESNPRSDILWDKYHALQLELAKNGVAADRHAELGQKIESLQKRFRMKTGMYEKYDPADFISSEESAAAYLKAWAQEENGMDIGTPEEVDNAWESVKQAAQRQGFTITPAITDAYAEARAIAESRQHATQHAAL